MRLVEEITAKGHMNVRGTHGMTFEITKDSDLSNRGDCVIGVEANKGPVDFSSEFTEACRRDDARITVKLEAAGVVDIIHGVGSHKLTFTNPRELVGRKSTFTSDRTVLINADKAARDVDRRLIEALRSARTRLRVEIIVEV